MTLEEELQKILDDNPPDFGYWMPIYQWEQFESYNEESLERVKNLVNQIIYDRLEEALFSDCKYVREYAQRRLKSDS